MKKSFDMFCGEFFNQNQTKNFEVSEVCDVCMLFDFLAPNKSDFWRSFDYLDKATTAIDTFPTKTRIIHSRPCS